MSIQNQMKVINRVHKSVISLQNKYAANTGAGIELKKLDASIKQLEDYLNKLDQLKPNYSTNEINPYVEAINLHMDILKVEMDQKDYSKLSAGVKVMKTILRFHPVKYSYFTFIIAWIFEMVYFI